MNVWPELLTGVVSAVVTVLLLSYFFGDTGLYRWTLAIIVGVGAGYAMAMVLRYLHQIWIKPMLDPALPLEMRLYYAIPILLGATLLFKGFPRLSRLGNLAMAILLGSGVAVAFTGALLGTVIPQIMATGGSLSKASGGHIINGFLVLVGTIIALLAFSPRQEPQREQAQVGQVWLKRTSRYILIIGLAVAYAGALTSALMLLVSRLAFVVNWIFSFFNIGS